MSGSTARAILVSVVIMTGASLTSARAQTGRDLPPLPDRAGDETAFAVARPSLGGDGNAVLPHPLSAGAALRYRAIFRAVRRGDFQMAQVQTGMLYDHLLLEDVLAERYLHAMYRPSIPELKDWLQNYPDSQDAPAIQDLLVRLAPPGTVTLRHFKKPLSLEEGAAASSNATDAAKHAFARNPLLDRTVADRVALGPRGAESALRLIDATPGMKPPYAAQLYGEVALSLLSQGKEREALRIGSRGLHQGEGKLGFPAYVAGLAAWRSGQMDAAYVLFEDAANAPLTDDNLQAAAAFWAARVKARHHEAASYIAWLRRASGHAGTFYGTLARRMLDHRKSGHLNAFGELSETTRENPTLVLGEIDVQAVSTMAQGRHLFALLQIGERKRAEALLRRMWADVAADPSLARSLQLVAETAGFEELSGRMTEILTQNDHPLSKKIVLPLPSLKPRHGFRVNPALVYAVTRLESNFNPQASSSAGAQGLMQIRPLTARFVTARHGGPEKSETTPAAVPLDWTAHLSNPSFNLEIGQLYLLYLASESTHLPSAVPAGGDLLRVLASYNAGPGAISHWENRQGGQDDPFYFIETLPNAETRHYVHNVLLNTWLYAKKMRLSSPSLMALSHAHWPSFKEEMALAQEPILN